MKPTLPYLFLSLLLAAGLIGNANAESVSDTSTAKHQAVTEEAPITAKNMLEKIRDAMAGVQLLNEDFYADENLKKFFGQPYVFQALLVPKELNISVISFDSVAQQDQESQDKPDSATHAVSTFKSGKIYLSPLANKQVIAHFVVAVNGSATQPGLVDIALIKEVFGEPTSISDDKRADEDNKTNPLGYSWMNYQVEHGDIFKNILFRTDGNGAVAEMQIYIGRKQ